MTNLRCRNPRLLPISSSAICKTEVRSLLEYVDDDGDGRLDFSEILEYAWWHLIFIVFIISYRFIKLGCFMFSLCFIQGFMISLNLSCMFSPQALHGNAHWTSC